MKHTRHNWRLIRNKTGTVIAANQYDTDEKQAGTDKNRNKVRSAKYKTKVEIGPRQPATQSTFYSFLGMLFNVSSKHPQEDHGFQTFPAASETCVQASHAQRFYKDYEIRIEQDIFRRRRTYHFISAMGEGGEEKVVTRNIMKPIRNKLRLARNKMKSPKNMVRTAGAEKQNETS